MELIHEIADLFVDILSLFLYISMEKWSRFLLSSCFGGRTGARAMVIISVFTQWQWNLKQIHGAFEFKSSNLLKASSNADKKNKL